MESPRQTGSPAGSSQLRLADGRLLAYQCFGAADGFPVLYCHGFPGSRLEAVLLADAATHAGVRLIAADRPGFGRSSFQADRLIGDWSADLAALARHLDLARFAILGVSGGGPYAISSACALAERVTRLGLVAAVDSLGLPGTTTGMNAAQAAIVELARRAPVVARGINTWVNAPLMRHFPASALYLLTATAPAADRDVLALRGVRETWLASVREAFRQGGRGPALDLELLARHPAVDASRLATPTLLWHGEEDATVPVAVGRRLAGAIPGCDAHFLTGEGHFSLPVRRAAEILAALAAP